MRKYWVVESKKRTPLGSVLPATAGQAHNTAVTLRCACVDVSVKTSYGQRTAILLDFQRFNRPLKNVFEEADARQKQVKKHSLCVINEHFEPVFNTAAATQIVFQRPVKTAMKISARAPMP